jgi:hypothetical protein
MKRDGTLPNPVKAGAVVAALIAAAGAANGEIIGPGITVTASSSLGTASYVVQLDDPFAETFPNGNWRYVLPDPVVMQDADGDIIATINDVRGDIFTNPHVVIAFDVMAGPFDTVFTVTGGLETVGPFPAGVALGGGSAGMTWADSNAVNGVTVSGGYDDGNFHRMLINGVAPGGGDTLASIIAGPRFAPSGTDSTSANTGGVAPGVDITSITSQFAFTVTAGDSVTGTSSFTVLPTPGAAALLGLGLFTLGFRGSRKP